MHIAICFWGLLRALQFTVDNIHEQILLPLERYGHTYDIFVHTYKLHGLYNNPRNHEAQVHLNDTIWHLLNPQYIYVEDQDVFDELVNYPLFESKGDPWHNKYESFKNHVRALNSLHHVTSVLESLTMSSKSSLSSHSLASPCDPTSFHSQPGCFVHQSHRKSALKRYDAAILVRSDVEFLSELPVQLLSMLPSPNRESRENQPILFLPDFHRSCYGKEYNDRFAMGSVSSVIQYGNKLLAAYDYSQAFMLHAEKFSYYHMQHTILHSCRSINKTLTNPFYPTSSHQSTTLNPLDKPSPSSPFTSTINATLFNLERLVSLTDTNNTFHTRVIEIPFRFQRIRSNGERNERDSVLNAAEVQWEMDHNVSQFNSSSTAKSGSWQKKWKLKISRIFRPYMGDDANIYCDPHGKMQIDRVLALKELYPPKRNLFYSSIDKRMHENKTHASMNSKPLSWYNEQNPTLIHCQLQQQRHQYTTQDTSVFLVPICCSISVRDALQQQTIPEVAMNHQRPSLKIIILHPGSFSNQPDAGLTVDARFNSTASIVVASKAARQESQLRLATNSSQLSREARVRAHHNRLRGSFS